MKKNQYTEIYLTRTPALALLLFLVSNDKTVCVSGLETKIQYRMDTDQRLYRIKINETYFSLALK